jgi:hypothetical protein
VDSPQLLHRLRLVRDGNESNVHFWQLLGVRYDDALHCYSTMTYSVLLCFAAFHFYYYHVCLRHTPRMISSNSTSTGDRINHTYYLLIELFGDHEYFSLSWVIVCYDCVVAVHWDTLSIHIPHMFYWTHTIPETSIACNFVGARVNTGNLYLVQYKLSF